MSKTIQLINKYRTLIQEYIKSRKETPRPHDVLFELLESYQNGTIPVLSTISNFFSPPKYLNLAKQLSILLKQPNVDILEVLNTNLRKIKLDKDEDLFALLIAYFYYFKNTYPNVANYGELKRQVLIPLAFFRQRLLNDDVDFLLKLAEDEKLIFESLRALENVPIPAKKSKDVLRVINKHDHKANVPSNACELLGKCQVPENSREDVVDQLLKQIDQSNNGIFRDETSLAAIFKVLGEMDLPDRKRKAVIKMLFAMVDDNNSMIREASWKALIKLKPPQEKISAILDNWINNLGSDDFITCNGAIVRLATAPIPITHQKIVIKKLLEKANNTTVSQFQLRNFDPGSDCIRRVACLALGRISVISEREVVLKKLIERMSDGVHEAYDALSALGVPESLNEGVINILLDQITSKDKYYNSLELLSRLSIPREVGQTVIDKLFIILDSIPSCHSDQVFKVFLNFNLDDKTKERVINLLFAKAEIEKKQNSLGRYGCYQALAKMTIPDALKNLVLNKIIEEIQSECGIVPIVCSIKIELNASQKGLIIDILLNKLASLKEAYDASSIIDGISNILGRNSVHTEWSTTLVKLEAILQKASTEQKPAILSSIHKFSKIIEDMGNLPQILPVEIKANIVYMAR